MSLHMLIRDMCPSVKAFRGRGFNSRRFRCQITTLGMLFTHMYLCHKVVNFGTGQRAVMLLLNWCVFFVLKFETEYIRLGG